jgi:hypothetical protein
VRASRRSRKISFAYGLTSGLAIGVACAAFAASINVALARCQPDHFRAPYFIKDMGACNFNSETLSFRGTPAQQAMCLMRGMDATRNLAPTLEGLPPGLAKRVGETSGLPSREALSAYLSKLDLEWDYAAYLWQPVSRAHDNDPDAPMAKYFVIHDTSGPFYGHRDFPDDININPKVNNLQSFACADEWGKAHYVVNRMGDSLLNHDFSIPWRETKFEQAAEFGGALKGLFVHIEMIQPRRAGNGGGDGHSPDPAFTPAQYDRLALLYTIVSVRAGRWLVPAFHAALDADIRNGHDDPLNFKVDSFADSIDRLMESLQGPAQFQASNATTATDAQSYAPLSASGGFWIDALWGTPHKIAAVPTAEGTENPPNANAVAATDGAGAKAPETNNAAAAASPAAAPPSATASAAEKPAAPAASPSVTPAPHPAPNAKVAERESEPPRAQKKSADAEACTPHRARGHRHATCEPDSAGAQEHGHEHGRHIARSSRRHRA